MSLLSTTCQDEQEKKTKFNKKKEARNGIYTETDFFKIKTKKSEK